MMETLIIQIKNKKDSKLIKDLLSRLNVEIENSEEMHKSLPKSKFKSKKEFLAYAGSMKGQLVSKSRLQSLAWNDSI